MRSSHVELAGNLSISFRASSLILSFSIEMTDNLLFYIVGSTHKLEKRIVCKAYSGNHVWVCGEVIAPALLPVEYDRAA
jgi:hypothetical protein